MLNVIVSVTFVDSHKQKQERLQKYEGIHEEESISDTECRESQY